MPYPMWCCTVLNIFDYTLDNTVYVQLELYEKNWNHDWDDKPKIDQRINAAGELMWSGFIWMLPLSSKPLELSTFWSRLIKGAVYKSAQMGRILQGTWKIKFDDWKHELNVQAVVINLFQKKKMMHSSTTIFMMIR